MTGWAPGGAAVSGSFSGGDRRQKKVAPHCPLLLEKAVLYYSCVYCSEIHRRAQPTTLFLSNYEVGYPYRRARLLNGIIIEHVPQGDPVCSRIAVC